MNERLDASPSPFAESYSPQRRTGLILTGVGTDGAYHAGVLRALHEAGVKIDIVAGRGIGVVGALFAAIDGAQQLWSDKGFWRGPGVRSFYRWRPTLTLAVWAIGLSIAIVALPIATVAAGLVVFPIDFIARMTGSRGAPGLIGAYLQWAQAAFAPAALPTWLPRLVVLVLGLAGVIVALSGWIAGGRRPRRFRWWRVAPSPLSAAEVTQACWRAIWDLLRGAAQLKQPSVVDLGRRYTELLAENLGQPAFRELLLVVHDLDARRDLVFALVAETRRRDLVRRSTTEAAEARRADVFDLGGVARDHLADAVAGALAIPIATEPHALTFTPDAYWRGETHRLCDRPGSVARILDELADLDVEQVILVSAASESPGPHALAAPRADAHGRIGEYLQSAEAAAIRDHTKLVAGRIPRVFTIRPLHNAIGPLDMSGGYDDRSDRRQPLAELMSRGYEDAYHQFIEPVVGASGERVGQSAI